MLKIVTKYDTNTFMDDPIAAMLVNLKLFDVNDDIIKSNKYSRIIFQNCSEKQAKDRAEKSEYFCYYVPEQFMLYEHDSHFNLAKFYNEDYIR